MGPGKPYVGSRHFLDVLRAGDKDRDVVGARAEVESLRADRDRLAAELADARAEGEARNRRIAELEEEREALRRRLGPKHAVPDTVYYPDTEWCVPWVDRFDEEQIVSAAHDGPVRYEAMVRVADRWCVMVPLAVEEDGSWDGSELRWFDTEKQAADAREAAGGNILARAARTSGDTRHDG